MPIANRDRVHWVSGCNRFDLLGGGRFENLGLWEVFQDTLCSGSESFIELPVNVPVGGKLLLSTNALVDLTGPSSLTVAGQLEIQDGARLRMDGSQTTSLLAGSNLSGTGAIRLDGSSQLVTPGDLDSSVSINQVSAASRLVVPGTYFVRTS